MTHENTVNDTLRHWLAWPETVCFNPTKSICYIMYAPTELCLSVFFLFCVCVSVFSFCQKSCMQVSGWFHPQQPAVLYIIAIWLPLNIDQETHSYVLGTQQMPILGVISGSQPKHKTESVAGSSPKENQSVLIKPSECSDGGQENNRGLRNSRRERKQNRKT